jgi:hypothetical protein
MQRQSGHYIAAIAMFLCGGTYAAIGNEGKADSPKTAASSYQTSTTSVSVSATEAAQFRHAGANACVQAVDVISVIGERFHQIALEATDLALNARDRYVADVEPRMHELRDRLRERIQRAEQLLAPERSAKR